MILAISTSTHIAGLALLDETAALRAEWVAAKKRGHYGELMPALDRLLQDARTNIHAVAAVAVAIGPGSFTGVRVGLAAAKGLCHALNVPIVGINSLDALAAPLPPGPHPVAAVLDSRRGEFFAARFLFGASGHLQRQGDALCLRADDLWEHFPEPTLFVGSDHGKQGAVLRERLGSGALLAPLPMWCLRPAAVGSLALEKLRAGDVDDPTRIEPLYLRPPDIRLNRYTPDPGRTESSDALRQGD